MEIGLYSFGEIVPDPSSGRRVSPTDRMKQIIDAAKLADDVGLDVFGLGEHHTLDFTVSATAATLAAIASVTKNIRLTSASTLIGTADPVRTFQEFATVDLISKGRAELVFGRGAFPHHFPLFGYEGGDYDALFAENVELFRELNDHDHVTWSGRFRPSLLRAEIAPRPNQPKLPVWIGALSDASVLRAARWGYPLAMPLVGGAIADYARTAHLYRQGWQRAGHELDQVEIAAFSHLHVSETSRAARDAFYPYYSAYFSQLGGRGGVPRTVFNQMSAQGGTLILGSPQEVIDRLLTMRDLLGLTRYVGQFDVGGQPFPMIAKAIELFGTRVAPVLRAEAARTASAPANLRLAHHSANDA